MESFYLLIDDLLQAAPEARAAGERRLRDAFEVERAVLALDMSGFSLSVRRDGVLAHLCQIRRVQRLALPLIEDHGGEVVKCEADNILAVFPAAQQAVEAALAINGAIAASMKATPQGAVLTVGIGIDFGRLLLVPGQDAFGDPVNVAYKLGEDVARPSEILVTEAVTRSFRDPPSFRTEPMVLSLSGLAFQAFRIVPGHR